MDIPLRDVVKSIDFRRFYDMRGYKSDRNGNWIGIPCPRCDMGKSDGRGNRHCAIYDTQVLCYRCGEHWEVFRWLTEVEGYGTEEAALTIRSLAAGDVVRNTHKFTPVILPLLPEENDAHQMEEYAEKAYASLVDRSWWHGRGVSDAAIDGYHLGYLSGWYTIPTRDRQGHLFSVKKRWAGETVPEGGVRYCTHSGSKPSYSPWILPGGGGKKFAVLVAGEIKALSLWSYLQGKENWDVIASCAGEGKWNPLWNRETAYAEFAVWPDNDQQGRKFMTEVRKARGNAVPIIPASPLKAVDDYILAGGDPVQEIRRVMKFHD